MRRFLFRILGLVLIAVVVIGIWKVFSTRPTQMARAFPQVFTTPAMLPPLTRPYGMAPVAWKAYLRACKQARIHPYRLGQTIGNHPRSVGYHKRDGVLRYGKQRIDYCAAVDLGTWDLPEPKIHQFVDALAAQGFAAWYRSGPKWKNGEHIHAIYAFLPMKPQLQGQLRHFLRERRRAGRSPKWRAKLRSQENKLKHWMVW